MWMKEKWIFRRFLKSSKWLALQRTPIFLEILFSTTSICFFHVTFSSMTTPSNLTAFPLLILMLFCMSWLVAGTGENHTLTLYEIKHTLFFLHLVKAYWLKGITKPCTHLHPAPSTSPQLHPAHFNLHPAHFSLHPALCNTLNNIWTKILHIIGQFPQI